MLSPPWLVRESLLKVQNLKLNAQLAVQTSWGYFGFNHAIGYVESKMGSLGHLKKLKWSNSLWIYLRKGSREEERIRKERKRKKKNLETRGCYEAWLYHELLLWASYLNYFKFKLNIKWFTRVQMHLVNNRPVNFSSLNIKDYLLSQVTKMPGWSCSKLSGSGNAAVCGIPKVRFFPLFSLSRQHLYVRLDPAEEAFSFLSLFSWVQVHFPRSSLGDFWSWS